MEVSSVTDVSGVLIRSMGVVVCCSCGLGVKTCLCFHFTYGKLSWIICLTLLFVYFLWCYTRFVARRQLSPFTPLLYAERRQSSACQRKGYSVISACSPSNEIQFLSISQTITRYSAGCCFPRRNSNARKAELSMGVDQWCTSGWAFRLHCQSFYRRVIRGTLGKSQPGHELDGKSEQAGRSEKGLLEEQEVSSISLLVCNKNRIWVFLRFKP